MCKLLFREYYIMSWSELYWKNDLIHRVWGRTDSSKFLKRKVIIFMQILTFMHAMLIYITERQNMINQYKVEGLGSNPGPRKNFSPLVGFR